MCFTVPVSGRITQFTPNTFVALGRLVFHAWRPHSVCQGDLGSRVAEIRRCRFRAVSVQFWSFWPQSRARCMGETNVAVLHGPCSVHVPSREP